MLDKFGEGTRYIYTGNSLEQFALLPNAVSVGYARCDERDERESRLAGETMVKNHLPTMVTTARTQICS